MRPYYSDDAVTIYHGDALDVLERLGANAAHWALLDPPFYLPANYYASRRSDWPKSLGDMSIMHGYFQRALTATRAALVEGGGMYAFSDTVSHAVFVTILYPLFDDLMTVVWDKKNGGMGRGWRHSHELILHGRDKLTQYAPGFRRDVLAFPTVPSRDRQHPAEKPFGLLVSLLESMPETARVIDPFAGGGTLGLAAKATGRHAVLIEIEERYCEIAAKRMQQEGLPLRYESVEKGKLIAQAPMFTGMTGPADGDQVASEVSRIQVSEEADRQ